MPHLLLLHGANEDAQIVDVGLQVGEVLVIDFGSEATARSILSGLLRRLWVLREVLGAGTISVQLDVHGWCGDLPTPPRTNRLLGESRRQQRVPRATAVALTRFTSCVHVKRHPVSDARQLVWHGRLG